jgi:hypothetical protein
MDFVASGSVKDQRFHGWPWYPAREGMGVTIGIKYYCDQQIKLLWRTLLCEVLASFQISFSERWDISSTRPNTLFHP